MLWKIFQVKGVIDMSDEFEKAEDFSTNSTNEQSQKNQMNNQAGNDAQNSVYRYKKDDLNQQVNQQSAQNAGFGAGQNYQQAYGANARNYNANAQNGYQNYQQSGQTYGQQSAPNGQNYYQQQAQQPKRHPHAKKPKTKWPGWAKAICYGLIFGLVAGGSIEGIHAVANIGSTKAIEQTADASSGSTTLDVVKVSSKNVETVEAQSVSDIVKEVMPSIVAVNTVVETTSQDFFGRTYSQEGEGAGSGIIFSEDGQTLYVLTNYHVIEGSKSIKVTFSNESSVDAEIKGYDENADIAVLTVNMNDLDDSTKSTIKVAVLGDSDALEAGDGAIAIGNALGYGQSVTTGCISAVERTVQLTDGSMTLIQTSAAINPGNSGGALLNAKGEVIGINTVKYSDTTVEGMGFAIPINSAIETVNDIISGKIVNKSDSDTVYLGIRGGTIDETTAQKYGYPQGVFVSTVYQNSAAARAGLQAGYIITGFNGQTITTMEELQEALAACSPGDSATITVSVPDDNNQYSSEETLTTILGSKDEAPQTQQ
jgi:serine protease Do